MEKQKYLYKNSKCVAGTSSTVSLINAWISMTGQRNIQKYRSIAYLGGVTILALATIWFLSQSQTYTINYDSKEKSKKPDKQNKKKGAGTSKSDKRSNNANKNSIGWWSSLREKIANKLGFGKKSKSQKNATKVGKISGSRNTILKIGKSAGKKRTFKDHGNTSKLPNGLSDLNNTKNDVKSPEVKRTLIGSRSENKTFNSNSSVDNVQKEDQITRETLIEPYDDNSPIDNKYQSTQKIQAESYGGDSSSDLRQKVQETRVESCGNNFISEVKQQQLRKLKLKVHEIRSSNWINRNKLSSRNHTENKHWLADCSKSKYPEKDNLTSPIHNVKCPTKPLCQDVDNKDDSNHQDHLLTRVVEKIKKIRSIDLQDREKCQEFYIPYVPLTSCETFDKIGQERIEYYKKLLVKLTRQKQQDSKFESMLRTVKEFFHEKKYYLPEDDGDFIEERADRFDELYDFFNKFEQNIVSAEVTNKDNVSKCPTFVDVLAQVDETSRKRIERSFEILRMIDSYQQQGKETEASIKKSIEMFNKQRTQYKGMTRYLKRPSAFHDELNQLKDRLMDTEQQVKDLATSLDDMEAYLTEMLELSDDDDKMNTAVAKYGPILNDDV